MSILKPISDKECLRLTALFINKKSAEFTEEINSLKKGEIIYFFNFLLGFMDRPITEYYKNHPERKLKVSWYGKEA